MNEYQKKYAMERVLQIQNEKVSALEASMPSKKRKTITYKEALLLITSGKVKLNTIKTAPDSQLYLSRDIGEVFDFSKFVEPEARYNEPKYDIDEFNKKKAPIIAKAKAIRDKIMLGDPIEALEMITSFEKQIF